MKRQLFGALGPMALAITGPAHADRSEFLLSPPTVIADLDGQARVLFREPDLSALEDHWIFNARLEFILPVASGPRNSMCR